MDSHSSIVRLDVGGMKFTTKIDTLTLRDPKSRLAAMISSQLPAHRDSQKGTLLIDRDGTHFQHILNWLRDGVVPILDTSGYQELLREAGYYQLLDLSGVDFSYACLQNVFFSRANLHYAKFRDAKADGSNFYNAVLRECEFIGATLQGALLAGANLQSANLQDACLVSCSFCEADLRSAHLQGAKLNGANLQGANLQRAYLRDVDLRDTDLEGAKLGGANLVGATR